MKTLTFINAEIASKNQRLAEQEKMQKAKGVSVAESLDAFRECIILKAEINLLSTVKLKLKDDINIITNYLNMRNQ